MQEKLKVAAEEIQESLRVKISWYWPPLGGPNCYQFVGGECISNMANGEDWRQWVGRAIACPRELAFGTVLNIGGRDWICKDRGGKITVEGGSYWVDMLTPYALYPFGFETLAEVVK